MLFRSLDRVGCFAYSPVESADANALPDWVPTEVAEERRRLFMETQAQISAARLQRFAGRELTVLVDRVVDDKAIARSFADAPEIDGVVQISHAAKLKSGRFTKVLVTASDHYDLFAQPSD